MLFILLPSIGQKRHEVCQMRSELLSQECNEAPVHMRMAA